MSGEKTKKTESFDTCIGINPESYLAKYEKYLKRLSPLGLAFEIFIMEEKAKVISKFKG